MDGAFLEEYPTSTFTALYPEHLRCKHANVPRPSRFHDNNQDAIRGMNDNILRVNHVPSIGHPLPVPCVIPPTLGETSDIKRTLQK